jgi:hypothetical protein
MTLQIKLIYKIIKLCGNYLQVAIQQKTLMENFKEMKLIYVCFYSQSMK